MKTKDYRQLNTKSAAEIKELLSKSIKELVKAKLQYQAGQTKKYGPIVDLKKTIAQLKTLKETK